MSTQIETILSIRNQQSSIGHTVWLQQPFGVKMVNITAFEPDPNTYRDDYYYHAVLNTLYVKVPGNKPGLKVWKTAN